MEDDDSCDEQPQRAPQHAGAALFPSTTPEHAVPRPLESAAPVLHEDWECQDCGQAHPADWKGCPVTFHLRADCEKGRKSETPVSHSSEQDRGSNLVAPTQSHWHIRDRQSRTLSPGSEATPPLTPVTVFSSRQSPVSPFSATSESPQQVGQLWMRRETGVLTHRQTSRTASSVSTASRYCPHVHGRFHVLYF